MTSPSEAPNSRMAKLQHIVTKLVTATLADAGESKPDTIGRLRRVESRAQKVGADPQTMQIILSGCRLLGDKKTHSATIPYRMPTNRWLR